MNATGNYIIMWLDDVKKKKNVVRSMMSKVVNKISL